MEQSIREIEGIVIKGRQIGRTIGFPTANVSLNSEFICLDHGVYGVKVFRGTQQLYGIMNVGSRPTFNDGIQISYEVHLFDFHEDIYHENIKIQICFYVRQERRFLSIDELKHQISKDIIFVRSRFKLTHFTELNKVYEGSVASWNP